MKIFITGYELLCHSCASRNLIENVIKTPAFAGVTKFLTLFTVLFTLTACGCMLEEGDSTNISDYWNGCWAEAKGDPSEV